MRNKSAFICLKRDHGEDLEIDTTWTQLFPSSLVPGGTLNWPASSVKNKSSF